MNLEQIVKNIIKNKNGIYYSETLSEISYPKEGNELCYAIEEESFWFNHRNKIINTAIRKYTNLKLLFDIGGGNGYVSKYLEENGINTVLIEPGVAGCLNAKQRGLKNIICASTDNLDIVPSSLESVGMFDVLEHISEDEKFISDIYKNIIQNGYFVLTIPTYRLLWSKEDIDAGHFRRYTLKAIHQKLENAGFKVVYSTYFFSVLPLFIFVFRTIPYYFNRKNNPNNSLDKHKKEHKNREGIGGTVLSKIFNIEANRIKNRKKLRFGSSCLVVAQKK